MLNQTDKIMLVLLLVLLALSGGIHWQTEGELSVEPAIVPPEDMTVAAVVGEVTEKSLMAIPDFGDMVDISARKSAFFSFLLPMIEKENNTILQNRERIIALSSRSEWSDINQSWLADMAGKYRMRDVQAFDEPFFRELLNRVDIIPASLALAQSANESAWGTSRFARQGNNFFGQWCFRPGCGIVPGSRPEGETYEVQKFDNVTASVGAYIHNLNTNHQYQTLRAVREQKRLDQAPVTGADLAHGLLAYSSRGAAYVEELLSMINSNKLLQYDSGVRTL